MTNLPRPDRALLEDWLTNSHIEHYLCGECEGLHVRALQELEGVVNSRVFVQQTHLLCSTELEIRPMAVLPLASDLGRINMDYPSLKVFLDVVDDETPQLVVAANMLSSAGVDEQQFAAFMLNVIDGTRLLADECLQLDYLFAEASGPRAQGSRSVH
jgi:hypothetical protein